MWNAHLNYCYQQYRVERRPSCPQQTTFQHDSSICTTNQTANLTRTWVKSKERDRWFQTACNWRRGPVLAHWPSTRPDYNWYITVVFTLPALLQPLCTQTARSLAALLLLLLLLCLPAATNFYIVVFQTVSVVLEMLACVGREQHLCYLLFPPRHQRGISTSAYMYVLWFVSEQVIKNISRKWTAM